MSISALSAREIKHELGITNVPDHPKRIVVLEFSFIDALSSLNIAPVGIADDKKRERVIKEYIDIIGNDWVSVGTRKSPSLEVIASLKPDLIIADKKRHSVAYSALSQIAPTIVLDSLAGDYHNAIKQMQIIGNAVGKSKEMTARINKHKNIMQEYIKKIKPMAKGLSAQFAIANSEGLYLHSPISYNGSLLSMLGFSANMRPNNGVNFKKTYIATSLEKLSKINPDILIIGEYSDPSFIDKWTDDKLYKSLSAVKSGNLFDVNAHSWARLRGMLAAELVADELLKLMKKNDFAKK